MSGTAKRVQDQVINGWCNSADEKIDNGRWREVLTEAASKRGAEHFLKCSTLYINVCLQESKGLKDSDKLMYGRA